MASAVIAQMVRNTSFGRDLALRGPCPRPAGRTNSVSTFELSHCHCAAERRAGIAAPCPDLRHAMLLLLAAILCLIGAMQLSGAEEPADHYRDLFPDTWVAHDALGRSLPPFSV